MGYWSRIKQINIDFLLRSPDARCSYWRYFTLFPRALILLLLINVAVQAQVASTAGGARGWDYLELQPGRSLAHEQVVPYVFYREDPGFSYDVASCCEGIAESWQPLNKDFVDFGFSTSKYWLALPIRNSGDRDGRWIIDLNTRFMNGLDGYVVGGRAIEHIVHDSETQPFSQRKIQHRQVVGEFSLGSGEQAMLVIGYWSRGTTALPFAIKTERAFYQDWLKENKFIVAFFSAMLFMILFALAQFVILKSPVQLSYALYVGSGCLYIFHMDGLSFQYLWPQWPKWNADASLYIGLSIAVFAIKFARDFLHTRRVLPKFDRMLVTLSILTLVIMAVSLVVDLRGFKQYAFILTTLAVFLCMIAGFVVLAKGQKEARFYVLGWVSIFLAALFASISHWFENYFPVPLTFDFAKIGTFVDALMFAMAMADQANEIRKQRDRAHERERELLEQDLEAQKQINLLENQYQSALSLALQKSYTLASAGHDLRQPIVALKSAMNQVIQQDDVDATTINQFRQGFDYIERLIKEYLEQPPQTGGDQAKTDSARAATLKNFDHNHHDNSANGEESFSIGVVLKNIKSMFRDDAINKGLEFRCRLSSVTITANPVSIMRLLSNLVENAIKYTKSGKILVGCRRRENGIELQVWDTGAGFTEAQQQRYFCAYERDTESGVDGLGLGLSIVRKLVDEHHYLLTLNSQVGRGSGFKILIPGAFS